jgi:hypothetical protein
MPLDRRAHTRWELAAQPLGSTRPNVFRMPRTQFFSIVICDTIWARAASSARTHRHLAVPADAHDLRQTEGRLGRRWKFLAQEPLGAAATAPAPGAVAGSGYRGPDPQTSPSHGTHFESELRECRISGSNGATW